VTRFCLRKSRHCRGFRVAVGAESAGERSWFPYPTCVCVYSVLSTSRKILAVGFDNLTTSIRQLNPVSSRHCEQFLIFFCVLFVTEISFFVSDVNKMECVTEFVYDKFMKRDETCDT
jgi:hypothetical protein